MFVKTALVSLFAAFAAAQLHAPVGEPAGNPITRPLNEAVDAGETFTITWQPTTTNTVSLLLLKGPSNNVVPVGAPIAQGIANSGSFSWTVPAEFGPGLSATTGYGIQLIDDVTGQYQYSTQFGINVEDYVSSSSAVPSSTDGGYSTSTDGGYPTGTGYPSSSKPAPTSSVSASKNVTSAYPTSVETSVVTASTGYPSGNSTIVLPSKTMTVPSSLKTSATATATESDVNEPPQSTGAASRMQAGMGLVAGVGALFFML